MAKQKPIKKTIEEDWQSRGFSFGVWIDPPGQVWEGYVHDVDELFMLEEGEVELEMKGKAQMTKVGVEILIPADCVHSVRNKGANTSKWFYGYKRN